MKGILLNAPDPPKATLISPTDYSELGHAHVSSRRRWANSYMAYSMQFPSQDKSEAEALRYFVKDIRGDTEVWFDGGEFNDLKDFVEVGIGDGSRTQFQLPNFNVFASSLIVRINDWDEPRWTCYEAPGILELVSAPSQNYLVRAKYKFRSKCKLLYDEASALAQTDNFKSFATESVVFREVP
jgi:hypothetical protein